MAACHQFLSEAELRLTTQLLPFVVGLGKDGLWWMVDV